MFLSPITNYNRNNNLSFKSGNYYIRPGHKLLNSLGEMTFENYKKSSFIKKALIRKLTPKRIKELAKINCDLAEKTIIHLDNLYGKGNYSIIMLGRSLATIGEAIKEMGIDVKIIPLSGLRAHHEVKNIEVYKSFLDSIGLTKATLRSNPNKKYVLMDYVFEGISIRKGKKFLENEALLGKNENLVTNAINEVGIFDNNLYKLFTHDRFKIFSPIGKLRLSELKDAFFQANFAKECNFNIVKYLRKLFLFNMFDAIHYGNYCNKLPIKELKVLEKQETQTALYNKFNKAILNMKKNIDSLSKDLLRNPNK